MTQAPSIDWSSSLILQTDILGLTGTVLLGIQPITTDDAGNAKIYSTFPPMAQQLAISSWPLQRPRTAARPPCRRRSPWCRSACQTSD